MISNLLWIDANIDNTENTKYMAELETIKTLNLKVFKKVNEAINYIKSINFQDTKIIVSGSLYSEFVKSFKACITELRVVPKIIIFTENKEKFI